MPMYFAYGSNMDVAAMAVRCKGAKALGVARLPRHRFALMAEGYATVAQDPRAEVWGVLWQLGLADVRPLDAYESVATGLYDKVMQPVIKQEGGAVQALIYIGEPARPGMPARPSVPRRRGYADQAEAGYLEGVLRAGLAWSLPEPYLRAIATLGGLSLKDIAAAAGKPTTVESPLDERGLPRVRPRFATPLDPNRA